jgi:hypothetical protein
MSLHDEYARRTPYEMAFPDPDEAESLFRLMAEEASARGVETGDFARFAMLGSVGSCIRELRGEEGPAEAVLEYASLVFHAFHFTAAGQRVDLVSTAGARRLVEASPAGAVSEPPTPSGYLQLPQHLFWAALTPGEPPQSVDGLFWTLGTGDLLHVLVAMSLRPDRGLLVVPLPAAPWGDRDSWVVAAMRPEGGDFSSSLPGADLDGLYAFESAGEVLKLLARALTHIEASPASALSQAPAGEGPPPSTLPYHRLEPHA